jgi:glycosyltransferase involved in cell wall biosynthesis
MNILHITSTDLRGAGSCVVSLNALLNADGHNSKLVVVFKTRNDPDIVGFIKPVHKSIQQLLDKFILKFHKIQTRLKIGKTNTDYYFYNLDERKSNFTAKAILRKIDFKPDAIFIHWVSNFINTATINKLAQLTGAKMYWVLIDNAPITGGCHYPWNCKGYETDCDNCPALLTASKKYVAKRNFALKKANIPSGIQFLTLSTADKLRAEKCSFYFPRKASVIFHPINGNIFRMKSKIEARRELNLPQNKTIIFFAATDINERRKGYSELQEALTIFEQTIIARNGNLQKYLLITAGKQSPDMDASRFSISVAHLGYLSEQEMVTAFNAATMFVCPTLEDSGPGILGQAMMCGTPTVAFAVGAAIDMIYTGYTGYLAKPGNSADLATGIKYIAQLNRNEYKYMRYECRKTGISTCSFEAVGKKIKNLL